MVECVEHAGNCTAAVDAFFAGDTAHCYNSYGKFCGIQESKCRAADPDRAGLDIVPCNDIDAACAAHDQCFRDATIYGEGQPYKTPEDSCVCNLTLCGVYMHSLPILHTLLQLRFATGLLYYI